MKLVITGRYTKFERNHITEICDKEKKKKIASLGWFPSDLTEKEGVATNAGWNSLVTLLLDNKHVHIKD